MRDNDEPTAGKQVRPPAEMNTGQAGSTEQAGSETVLRADSADVERWVKAAAGTTSGGNIPGYVVESTGVASPGQIAHKVGLVEDRSYGPWAGSNVEAPGTTGAVTGEGVQSVEQSSVVERVLTLDVRRIRDALGLSRERMARVMDVSAKTIERWEDDGGLPASTSQRQRLAKLLEIADLGHTVYTPAGFSRFLQTPLGEFNGMTALQMLELGHPEAVLAALASDYEGAGY